jgi:transcription elongation GreA/GreB family factor
VTVEADGETVTYEIVGASDSDPAAGPDLVGVTRSGGRSSATTSGDSIVVRTPAGERHYRIVEVG